MAVGTYSFNYTMNLSNLKDFFLTLADQIKKKPTDPARSSFVLDALGYRRLDEMAIGLQRTRREEVFEKIMDGLSFYNFCETCPKEVRQLLGVIRIRTSGEVIRQGGLNPFEPSILSEQKDVVWVERKEVGVDKWFFDVTTVTKDGLEAYKSFINNIPVLKDSIAVRKEKHTFSSRYAFRPFPLAVELWLKEGDVALIPQDLKDFLEAATRYHIKREWRTSIILSAITVESLLADLYEEQYHEYAPNTPLGDIFQKVLQKTTFPPDVKTAIEKTNEARIAAVHRGRFSVSDRESLNALFGATKFTMWHFQ